MAGAQDMLEAARGQLGYREGKNNNNKFGRWYGMNNAPWCDIFVSWCAAQAKVSGVGKYAYTVYHVNAFKKARRWGKKPRVGAIVFYDFGSSGDPVEHVGIVESVNKDGSITAIEGNYQDRVARVRRRANIVGYGYPAYGKPGSSGSSSSKPAGKAPKWPGRYLKVAKPMMHGKDVRTWQAQMRKRGWSIAADGYYGAASAKICRQFQAEKKLGVDGIVGPATWRAAWEAVVT
ncbi:CHAP domain-containing protein [Actinomadura sp. HBU206391]|uniref:CHAP domain-containing protein n=1 Tax=Actinomadura sp. HBU206391 TaxID=2731692 RepID=UPI0016501E47|nr:CHAP domain-containing protein [Actinomadura sp. HBU206391]MBC6461726.1 CHAP domain-containing protein [Actinomadura sp. HBU206391]